jgi:hypothetical protein
MTCTAQLLLVGQRSVGTRHRAWCCKWERPRCVRDTLHKGADCTHQQQRQHTNKVMMIQLQQQGMRSAAAPAVSSIVPCLLLHTVARMLRPATAAQCAACAAASSSSCRAHHVNSTGSVCDCSTLGQFVSANAAHTLLPHHTIPPPAPVRLPHHDCLGLAAVELVDDRLPPPHLELRLRSPPRRLCCCCVRGAAGGQVKLLLGSPRDVAVSLLGCAGGIRVTEQQQRRRVSGATHPSRVPVAPTQGSTHTCALCMRSCLTPAATCTGPSPHARAAAAAARHANSSNSSGAMAAAQPSELTA